MSPIAIGVVVLVFAAAYYITRLLNIIARHLDRIATCLEKGGRLLDGARWQIEKTTLEK